MAPAPLPPHERSWRHPSEMAPTAVDVEHGTNGRGLVIATGATTAVLVAALVLMLAPPRSAPTAISATTLAAGAAQQTQAEPRPNERTQGVVRLDRNTVTRDNLVALSGAPRSVSAAPAGFANEAGNATSIPADDARVVVLTNSHAYDMTWADVEQVSAPDGSMVVTRSGELVGVFVDGNLNVIVD